MLRSLNKWVACFSRIRMEQLMSITQEETENLRRREVACESRGGEGGGVMGTELGSPGGRGQQSPIEGAEC